MLGDDASKSPLVQGRGLKPNSDELFQENNRVAPRAGAWIETSSDFAIFLFFMSPLVQGRGLKQRSTDYRHVTLDVAPRAGAWIETCQMRCCPGVIRVAPRAGAWIETTRCPQA